MTVAELIEALKEMPQDVDVCAEGGGDLRTTHRLYACGLALLYPQGSFGVGWFREIIFFAPRGTAGLW